MLISDLKVNLTGMMHGGSLSKVRSIDHLFERAANTLIGKISPIETERITALTSLVYDDVYNYPLPSDYRKIIDLYPQENRQSLDSSRRSYAGNFDLRKLIENNTISIESNEGTKFIRINWRKRSGKLLHNMNSLTQNGTWSAVGTASGLKAQTLYKISGNASIEFDVAVTGDGIQNTDMAAIDLTDEDEIADEFKWVDIPTSADLLNFNGATVRWGNDVSAIYWEGTAVTAQADGTAFKVGWNLLKFPWADATETGTVDPSKINSSRIVFDVDAAIKNLRVDNIIFTLGRPFDLKYYSQFIFKNSSGVWISRPTSDTDDVVLEGTALQAYIMECLKATAQQVEGEDSAFDIQYANRELNGDSTSPDPILRRGLYAKYRAEFPSMSKKAITSWIRPRNPNQWY